VICRAAGPSTQLSPWRHRRGHLVTGVGIVQKTCPKVVDKNYRRRAFADRWRAVSHYGQSRLDLVRALLGSVALAFWFQPFRYSGLLLFMVCCWRPYILPGLNCLHQPGLTWKALGRDGHLCSQLDILNADWPDRAPTRVSRVLPDSGVWLAGVTDVSCAARSRLSSLKVVGRG
jgi:hypothetical protein